MRKPSWASSWPWDIRSFLKLDTEILAIKKKKMYWIKNEELFLSNDITEIMKKTCHTGQNEEL